MNRSALRRIVMTFLCIYVMIVTVFSVPTNQQKQQQLPPQTVRGVGDMNFYETARKLLLEGDTNTFARSADNFVKSVPYFRASIPMRIFECLRAYNSVLRCTKLFMLQKMEERKTFPSSGNITKDFLDQFFGQEEQMGSLIGGQLANISEKELHQRLVSNFQRFFHKRDIQLHLLPGISVNIVPGQENKLKLALKRKNSATIFTRHSKKRQRALENISSSDDNDNDDADYDAEGDTKKHGGGGGGGIGEGGGNKGGGGGGKHKKSKKKRHSYKDMMIQMAVPVMVMPAILMGTFLPFLLPVLKMATFMSMMMNNSAFIAALIYAARTHINAQDESAQHINYSPQGFH